MAKAASRQATQYVVHPRLEGLISALDAECVQCHLDYCRTPRRIGSTVVGDDIDVVIVAVVADATSPEGSILQAARVPVERVPTQVGSLSEREQLQRDATERIGGVIARLRELLTEKGISVVPGLRFLPGLSDDLERNLAEQHMWRLVQEGRNPLTRYIEWL